MRRILRSIAHARMKKEGIRRPNKPRKDLKGRKVRSYFAEHWREYLAPKAQPKRKPKLKRARGLYKV